MPTLFDLIYGAAVPFVAPKIAYRWFAQKKYHESLPGMLGCHLNNASEIEKFQNDKRVSAWLHAVSVGEVVAAGAVLQRLSERHPEWRYMASTVTETGQLKARKTLHQANEIFYYPFDFSWNVRRFLKHYRPELYIIHETELWPNFLLEARRQKVDVFWANGKLSPRSAERYRKMKRFFKGPLGAFRSFCVQTEQDAERLESIGISIKKIHVTGNCKFDNPGEPLSEQEQIDGLASWGWGPDEDVMVVGSTHPGEEKLILHVFRALRKRIESLRLLIAPRHPERFEEVARLIQSEGWKCWRTTQGPFVRMKSANKNNKIYDKPDVGLIDTVGELARSYGLGKVALVAGSWSKIGGHNLLEAAVHAIPVIYGPNMQNQPDMLRLFQSSNSGFQLKTNELLKNLYKLFQDLEYRTRMGKAAAETVDQNRGAASRTVERILANRSKAKSRMP